VALILSAGTLLQGRYRVERLLGQGGMSRVYLAQHLHLARPVALKAVQLSANVHQNRQHAAQLEVEAQIMASLVHPHLAMVLDFFTERGVPYLVMELISGRDLEQVAQLAPNPLRQRRVLEMADQLLSALEYLHERTPPVIVRDLKPSNVMLDAQGQLKLIDFGLAKRLDPQQGTTSLTKGMGSVGYAPLEQYGEGSTDQRSDLYALGATLYFLLTDQAPPEAAARAAGKADLTDPRTLNPSVTAELWSELQALMALNPDQRPASAREVRRRLGLQSAAGVACPRCQKPLVAVARDGVMLDQCQRCGGFWLDRGELEQLGAAGRSLWQQFTALLRGAP